MRGEKRKKRMLIKARHCSSSSLQQRVESLQRHVDILQSAKKDAVLSARELRRANEKITAQLNSLTEKLRSSKLLTQVTWGKTGRRVSGRDSSENTEVCCYSAFVCLFCGCFFWAQSEAIESPLPLSCLISMVDRPTLVCGGQCHGAEERKRISIVLSMTPLLSRHAECFNKPVTSWYIPLNLCTRHKQGDCIFFLLLRSLLPHIRLVI